MAPLNASSWGYFLSWLAMGHEEGPGSLRAKSPGNL